MRCNSVTNMKTTIQTTIKGILAKAATTLALALILWTHTTAAGTTPSSSPTLESLTNDLRRAESVREIKNLQKTYAQLAFYGRWAEMAALFVADDGILRWGQGREGNGTHLLSDSDAVESKGAAQIEAFLRKEAGEMDGIRPGSLHALINDQPLITLSVDGKSAKGRYHSLQLLGDGKGGTKIQGGLMENQYVLASTGEGGGDVWKIKLLRYFPMYVGDYKKGWVNVGNNSLPIVPYHYRAEDAGTPILLPESLRSQSPSVAPLDLEELKYRITRLNDEDEVRNLQHSSGHYVDRRMWPDVADLYAPGATVLRDGVAQTLEDQFASNGPAGLTRGVNNDHPIYQMTVEISPDGTEAVARGLVIGMLGNAVEKTAEWRFITFRHRYARNPNTNIWQVKQGALFPKIHANYSSGWGLGGTLPAKTTQDATPPPFLNVLGRLSNTTQKSQDWMPPWREDVNSTEDVLRDLERRLKRSTAWDESENVSSAYGYYIDDVRCHYIGTLHADKGFKQSPGVGWYRTPERIGGACSSRYGNGSDGALRSSVPLHWRLQPVILVSQDGRSSTARVRNLQIGTAKGTARNGYAGNSGFNGGMYHDQFVLEEKNGMSRRKLWSLVIDEFYWNSGSWAGGWAGVNSTAVGRRAERGGPVQRRQQGIGGYIADLSLNDPGMGPREVGFMGGPPPTVRWPEIQRMWWEYRNPVTGRVPADSYWPGCVPCKARPDWGLMANGYQEPATGPTLINATVDSPSMRVTATVTGGPDEPVEGVVQLRRGNRSTNLMGEVRLNATTGNTAVFLVRLDGSFVSGPVELDIFYLGSDRLQPGKQRVVFHVLPPV